MVNPLNSLPSCTAVRLIECFFRVHPYSVLFNKTLLLQSYWTDTVDPLLLSVVFGTTTYKSQILEGKPVMFWHAGVRGNRNSFLDYAYYLLSKVSSEATLSRYQAVVLLALFELAFGYPKRGVALFSLSYMIGTKLGVYESKSEGTDGKYGIQGINTACGNTSPSESYNHLYETFYTSSLIAMFSARIVLHITTPNGFFYTTANNAYWNTRDHKPKDIEAAIGRTLNEFMTFIEDNCHRWSDVQYYTLYTTWVLYKIHCTFLQSVYKVESYKTTADYFQGLKSITEKFHARKVPGPVPTHDFDPHSPDTIDRMHRLLPLVVDAIEKTKSFVAKAGCKHEVNPLPLGLMVSLLETCSRLFMIELKRSYDKRWWDSLELVTEIASSYVWKDWSVIELVDIHVKSFLSKYSKPQYSEASAGDASLNDGSCENEAVAICLPIINDFHGVAYIHPLNANLYCPFPDPMQDDIFEPIEGIPAPCNGFPDYRDIPINNFFYLGAHIGGSQGTEHCSGATQDNNVTTMLNDGIRLLDVELCTRGNKLHLCTSADFTLHDLVDEFFDFTRTQSKQLLLVHLNSKQQASLKQVEDVIDEVCKLHTERTLGTKIFEKRMCPFIYTKQHASRPWPSIGELLNYDPEMAQWEGDGEDVGVQSLVLFTHDDLVIPQGYKPTYFSPAFWKTSRKPGQHIESLDDQLQYMCKTPGAIYLRAYPDTNSDGCAANEKRYNPHLLESTIAGPTGCNLQTTPAAGTLNAITMDFYQKHLEYLNDLQKRMLRVNYEKWQGRSTKLEVSTLTSLEPSQEEPRVRDEL
ncbi:hypothetical protein DFQ30_000526 [Apophysomyces sp. BC1015]|nr:hypothetical protein DFQ30_000526 [Apophysomyces sp. BC1015]